MIGRYKKINLLRNHACLHRNSSWVEQGSGNREVAGSNLIWWIRLIFLLRNEYFMFIIYFILLYVYYTAILPITLMHLGSCGFEAGYKRPSWKFVPFLLGHLEPYALIDLIT